MTLRQAGFLKTDLELYLSEYEHLVDNNAAVEFAAENKAIKVYYMQNTHFFGKSEAVIEQLSRHADRSNIQPPST